MDDAAKVDAYYMCIYLDDGAPIAHFGSVSDNFASTLAEHRDKRRAEKAKQPKRSRMGEISIEFVHSMMGYLDYVPLILSTAPAFSSRMVSSSLRTFLEKVSISADRSLERVVYKVSLENYPEVKRFQDNLDAATTTTRILPRLLTIGLVTTLEYHLNLVMKEIATTVPERIFEKDRVIPVGKAVRFNSIDEMKDELINDEIDKVQRDAFDKQIGWIIDKAEMEDFTPKYAGWPTIIELLERRNLFVHANGVVNDYYLKALTKHSFKDKLPALGQELNAGPKYYRTSVHNVLHFGAMLLQVAWRKIHPDESEQADELISNLGFELISRGRYKLAIAILEFAINLRGVVEASKRANVINLANAYKLSGDAKKAETVLGQMDWSAVASNFKLCVAAVRNNVDDVCKIMKKPGINGEVSALEYQSWPVFFGVREDKQFLETFREIFGVEYVPSAKRQAGVDQVLQWLKDSKLETVASSEIDEPEASLQPLGQPL